MQFARLSLSRFPRYPNESDDIGRIQRAIEYIHEGGELIIPSGTYLADSIQINKSIHIRCSGVVEFIPTTKNKDILTIEGEKSNIFYRLEKNVQRRDTQITLTSSPHDLNPGDMIVLTDDTVRFNDHMTDVNTEIHEVLYVSGQTVWIRDYVRLPKSPAPSGMNLYKIIPIENVRIEGFRYRMLEGSTEGRGIYANMVRNLEIKNISGTRGAGSGVQVRKAINTHIQRFHFSDPQVVGSGQGYGVQFYGGCNGITIRDGYTYGMRHSVDLEGSFECLINNVVDVCSTGASFVLSHNGWCADITIQNCRAINCGGTGIVADSQGVSSNNPDQRAPLQLIFYGFRILNCEVISQSLGTSSIHFYSPCKEVRIEGCRVRFRTGRERNLSKLSNAGIRLYPGNTDVFIANCDIEGYRRGLAFQSPAGDFINPEDCQIHARDIRIRQCCSAIFFNYGRSKRVSLTNIHCDSIKHQLLELNHGTFSHLQMENINVVDSPSARFSNRKINRENRSLTGTVRHVVLNQQEVFPIPIR